MPRTGPDNEPTGSKPNKTVAAVGVSPAGEAVILSFELAAERCDDLTPLVYQRLFTDRPELEALFWREPKRQIEGEMLSRAIEALFDFIGERRYADMLISSEAVTHDGYEVPPEIFRLFFPAVRHAVRDLLGDAWSPAMEAAWTALISEIDGFIASAFQVRETGSARSFTQA